MDALTLCNACDARPMAHGQEAPNSPGYCAVCMRLAREGETGRCTYCRAPVETGAGRLVLNPDGTPHTCSRDRRRRHECGRLYIPQNATYCWFCHVG